MSATRRSTAAFWFLAASTAASQAWAGGFELPENGPRALGRGGAYVAGVDEPSAIYFNPAGLTRVRNSAVTANLNLTDARVSFQRASFEYFDGALETDFSRRTINFDEVNEQAGFFPAPMAFAASKFGLEDWTFGFGVYGPPSVGRARYPDMEIRPDNYAGEVTGVYVPGRDQPIDREGGQAYQIVSHDILLVYPSFATAYRIESANFSVGLTAQLAMLFVQFDVGVDGIFGDGSVSQQSVEADDLYSSTRLNATGFAPTGIVGLMWDPIPQFSVGLSYRPRFTIVANGDLDITYPDGLVSSNPTLDTERAKLTTKLPDVVRLGLLYRHLNAAQRELFDVELNVNYEAWSTVDGFDVNLFGRLSDEDGAVRNQALPDLFLGRYYDDAVSIRLGGDISALRDAETGNGPVFRLGGFFETASMPEEWTALDFTPLQRLSGAVGLSYHFARRFAFDVAYAFTGSPEREVTNGEYNNLAPLWICNDPSNSPGIAEQCDGVPDPTHAVNNGVYNISYHTIAAGLTWGW